MTFLLEYLNIPVVGYSLPAEKGSLYDRSKLTGSIPEIFADVRDYKALEEFIDLHKPSTIIHMAAQPLVLKSYERPRETFDVNVMGSVNVLDIAFKNDFLKAIIMVTTDKVYRNDNSGRAFVETDPLEGKDPYSASKVGSEAVVAAWQHIQKVSGGPRVIAVRGGNVIGGGDYAIDRLIPDLVRGITEGRPTRIRNPGSVRPWQHVLDPLVGYVKVLENSLCQQILPAFNFGPLENGLSVADVLLIGKSIFNEMSWEIEESENNSFAIEASNLNLNSDKAQKLIGWAPRWSQKDAVEKTFNWWRENFSGNISSSELCRRNIEQFLLE